MNLRWQAEWEKQDAVWLSWPHRDDTWLDHSLNESDSVIHDFVKLTSLLSRFQTVKINAAKNLHATIETAFKDADCPLGNIQLYPHSTNDVWCRDHGSTFVSNESLKQMNGIDWHYNAWGGKFPPWELDDAIAKQMADATNSSHYRSPLHLEGGAIEGNGNGIVITTEAVALNPNRNPKWSKSDVEAELKKTLGASTIFWLPTGIEGDDTDGHVDDLTRFIKEDAIVTAIEKNSSSPNYQTLEQNKEILQDLHTRSGSNVEIIDLPMPDPIRQKNWRLDHLPASYANFLIINHAVIVPTFGQHKNDNQALGILRECFPHREVIGFDSRNFIIEGGAIHCLTQQQPSIQSS